MNEEEINKSIFESRLAANKEPDVEVFQETTGVVTGCQLLNVRQSPNPDGDILGRLSEGTKVTLTKHEGDWYFVATPTLSGWCMATYISVVAKKQEG